MRQAFLISLLLVGCGSSGDEARPDTGTLPEDSGTDTYAPETTPPDAEPPPPGLEVERFGARVWGPILAVTRVGRSLWIGTGPAQDTQASTRVRGGLVRLDLDTGAVRVFEAELPQRDYSGSFEGRGPVATAGVAAIDGGVLAVQPEGLIKVVGDSVTNLAIKDTAGEPLPVFSVAVDGTRRVWVGTAAGILRLDGTTFEVLDRIAGANVTSIAIEGTNAYAVVGTELWRLGSDGAVLKKLVPGEGDVPAGAFSEVAVSKTRKKAYATIASWNAGTGGVIAWDGATVTRLALEGELGRAATGESAAFGAFTVTVDDDDDLLVIGGRQRPMPLMPTQGGGLVWYSLGTNTMFGATLERGLTGKHVRTAAYDPATRRTFASVMEQCSDTKLASRGLTAMSFRSDGSMRLERPLLSGVRALARSASSTWAALRDDRPELGCNGYTIQGGLVKVLSNGAGEVVDAKPDTTSSYRTFRAGLTALDVLDDTHVSMSGFREELFTGDLAAGKLINAAATWSVSNYPLEVKYASDKSLLLGGRATHDPFDNDEAYDDRAPRGLVWVRADRAIHYVRTSATTGDVAGLPSSEITAILPEATGGAIVACATERWHRPSSYDRVLDEPYPKTPRKGGLARIAADGTLSIVADGTVAPDPQALARAKDGSLWVLDLQRGLLHETSSGFVVVSPPTATPGAKWPHALWVGDSAEVAVGFDSGASIELGGKMAWIEGVGHVWRVLSRAQGTLLLGADEGLVRVHVPGSPEVAESAPGVGGLPPFGTATK